MQYVALLRGINVGGNNKIEMKKLKTVFEEAGLHDVTTYINSGNIVFQDAIRSQNKLVTLLEKAIFENFGLSIKVLIRDFPSIQNTVQMFPSDWTNDADMKCDVLFLWEDVDNEDVLSQLAIKPDIDEVRYVPGAVIWKIDRENLAKSGMKNLIGTKLYKNMTIRNCNTTRKILHLMEEQG